MKNLIIYLIAIMLSGSIALQKNDAPKVTPYKVVVETEDGKRFYIPNNLVDIKQETFESWYNSPYRPKLQIVTEF
jgi:hypothetical protein|tara:strand:- start:236 stop:460 length:225 start_codon:yes stop_codon:yes gene_type:complete